MRGASSAGLACGDPAVRHHPVALPYFNVATLQRGWQFGMAGSARATSLEEIPSILILLESGAHAEISMLRLCGPSPEHDKPGLPHWAYRSAIEPDGRLVTRSVVPVMPGAGVQPVSRATVPRRPLPCLVGGEIVEEAYAFATPAGVAYFSREAARAGVTFGPAAADLSRDFSAEPPVVGDTYHTGLYREIPLQVGPHNLGDALALGGTLLGVKPGPAAARFELWNVHLATVAAAAMTLPAGWKRRW